MKRMLICSITVALFIGIFAGVIVVYNLRKVSRSISSIEAIGGSVGVDSSMFCGPKVVHFKVTGVDSLATDDRLLDIQDKLVVLCDVQVLDLAGSPIGDRGFRMLTDVWGDTLRALDVADTAVSSGALQRILDTGSLEHISFSLKILDDPLVEKLHLSDSIKSVKIYECRGLGSLTENARIILQNDALKIDVSPRRSLRKKKTI